MDKVIKHNLIKEIYYTTKENTENVIKIDHSQIFNLKIQKIINIYHKYFINIKEFKNVKTVYNPGSSIAILEVLLLTNCTTLVCSDIVDELFYNSLSSTRKYSKTLENIVEFNAIIEEISSFHNIYSRYLPGILEEKIRSIIIVKDKCTIIFMYNNILRTIIVYINFDANKNIPNEFNGKHIDLLVESGFVLNDKMRIKLDPKMILYEDGNGNNMFYNTDYQYKKDLILEYPYFYTEIYKNEEDLWIDYDNPVFKLYKSFLFKNVMVRSYVVISKFPIPNNETKLPSIIKVIKTTLTEDHFMK